MARRSLRSRTHHGVVARGDDPAARIELDRIAAAVADKWPLKVEEEGPSPLMGLDPGKSLAKPCARAKARLNFTALAIEMGCADGRTG